MAVSVTAEILAVPPRMLRIQVKNVCIGMHGLKLATGTLQVKGKEAHRYYSLGWARTVPRYSILRTVFQWSCLSSHTTTVQQGVSCSDIALTVIIIGN